MRDADNQRLLDGIGLHHDRQRVLNFLDHPEVEPTNNRAERALRPAVIARKVSHCSKNERGAEAFAAFTNVARSAVKKGVATVNSSFSPTWNPCANPQPSLNTWLLSAKRNGWFTPSRPLVDRPRC